MSNTTNNSEDKASYNTSNFTDNKDTIEDEEVMLDEGFDLTRF